MADAEGMPGTPGGSSGAAGPTEGGEAGGAGQPAGPGAGDRGEVSVLRILLVLTFLSGLIDAVCYLGLGRVFTANMTGNIVVLGFAAAGAPGFSATASLTSLLVFLAGAIAGGRLSQRLSSRATLLAIAIGCEAALVGAAATVAFLAGPVGHGWARYMVIAILAFAMGIRNLVIRQLAIPDLSTTTVLTQTLTGLAADSMLAGGHGTRMGRRGGAVISMLAGATAGAAIFLHQGAGPALAVSAAVAAVTLATLPFSRAPDFLNKR
jgi:uncharacterized membrane protein YoaK (UPF0700 family)